MYHPPSVETQVVSTPEVESHYAFVKSPIPPRERPVVTKTCGCVTCQCGTKLTAVSVDTKI
jgi:hypothetical protein